MPKDTFYNLPMEKRQFIEEIAIKIFASEGYDNATINEVVRQCKIAKGSFYQYFKSKKDLFIHVMGLIGKAKLEHMSPVLQNPMDHNIFDLLREVYISALEFGANRPDLLKIALDMSANRRSEIYEELIKDSEEQSIQLFSGLLKKAIDKGEVKQSTDVHFMAYLITRFSIDLNDYYFEYVRNKMDFDEYRSEILTLVEKQIDILKNGIGV